MIPSKTVGSTVSLVSLHFPQILLSGQKTRCTSGQSGQSKSSSSPNSTCRASVGSPASNCAPSPSLNWRPKHLQSTAPLSTTSCRLSSPLARVSEPYYTLICILSIYMHVLFFLNCGVHMCDCPPSLSLTLQALLQTSVAVSPVDSPALNFPLSQSHPS